MLIFTYFFVSLIGLLIATYTDLKERMVYNKLTYAMVAIAFLLKAFESFEAQSYEPMTLALLSGTIAFIVSYFLWKTGVWAGGDVKLVTALALLNPVNYAALQFLLPIQNNFFSTIQLPIFPIELVVYSVFAALPLGVAMNLTAVFRHKEILHHLREVIVQRAISALAIGAVVAGTNAIVTEFSLITFAVLPVLVLLAFLPKMFRNGLGIIIAVLGVFFEGPQFAVNVAVVSIPVFAVYVLWKLYSESKEYAFKEQVETEKLEEGMIADRYIVERNGEIELVEGPSIKKVIKNLMSNKMEKALEDFKVEGKIIASPNHAGGLSKEAVEQLKAMARKGKAPAQLMVRKTMAFVPAILTAYIALQLTGDILWNIILP